MDTTKNGHEYDVHTYKGNSHLAVEYGTDGRDIAQRDCKDRFRRLHVCMYIHVYIHRKRLHECKTRMAMSMTHILGKT